MFKGSSSVLGRVCLVFGTILGVIEEVLKGQLLLRISRDVGKTGDMCSS